MNNHKQIKNLYNISFVWQIGISMLMPLLIFIGGGIWLDNKFATQPLWTLIGIGLGLFFSCYMLWQDVKMFIKK